MHNTPENREASVVEEVQPECFLWVFSGIFATKSQTIWMDESLRVEGFWFVVVNRLAEDKILPIILI